MPDESSETALFHDLFLEGGWESSSQAGPCPDDETIGALLAGTLSDAERERVEKHVASCERCYRTYASGMALLVDLEAKEEDGDDEEESGVKEARVIAFAPTENPAQRSPGALRAVLQFLPWAAAVGLITFSSWWFLREPGLPSFEQVTAILSHEDLRGFHPLMADPTRGPGPEDPDFDFEAKVREAFQAGGSSFDLWFAAERGSVPDMQSFAAELSDLASNQMTAAPTQEGLKRLVADLTSPTVDAKVAAQRARQLAQAAEELFSDRSTFAFGRLVEASRLTLRSSRPRSFSEATLSDGIKSWKKESHNQAEMVREDLQALEKALAAKPLDRKAVEDELAAVQTSFGFYRVDPLTLQGPEPEIRLLQNPEAYSAALLHSHRRQERRPEPGLVEPHDPPLVAKGEGVVDADPGRLALGRRRG